MTAGLGLEAEVLLHHGGVAGKIGLCHQAYGVCGFGCELTRISGGWKSPTQPSRRRLAIVVGAGGGVVVGARCSCILALVGLEFVQHTRHTSYLRVRFCDTQTCKRRVFAFIPYS